MTEFDRWERAANSLTLVEACQVWGWWCRYIQRRLRTRPKDALDAAIARYEKEESAE